MKGLKEVAVSKEMHLRVQQIRFAVAVDVVFWFFNGQDH